MSQRQKPLETVGRSSSTGPTKSTIRQQKLFLHRLYSEGTNCREQLQFYSMWKRHKSFTEKKKKSMISGCMLHISMSPQTCETQRSTVVCHLLRPTQQLASLPNSPQQHTQGFVLSRPSNACFWEGKILTFNSRRMGEKRRTHQAHYMNLSYRNTASVALPSAGSPTEIYWNKAW